MGVVDILLQQILRNVLLQIVKKYNKNWQECHFVTDPLFSVHWLSVWLGSSLNDQATKDKTPVRLPYPPVSFRFV